MELTESLNAISDKELIKLAYRLMPLGETFERMDKKRICERINEELSRLNPRYDFIGFYTIFFDLYDSISAFKSFDAKKHENTYIYTLTVDVNEEINPWSITISYKDGSMNEFTFKIDYLVKHYSEQYTKELLYALLIKELLRHDVHLLEETVSLISDIEKKENLKIENIMPVVYNPSCAVFNFNIKGFENLDLIIYISPEGYFQIHVKGSRVVNFKQIINHKGIFDYFTKRSPHRLKILTAIGK